MGVPTKQVKRTLQDPEIVYPSSAPGTRVAQRANIAVPFAERGDARIAITVLWHGKDSR
jgi:hypothetical protein